MSAIKLLARILRLSSAAPPPSFAESQLMLPEGCTGAQPGHPSRNSTRRDLLRVVLRDTLYRQGIPASWIGADALVCTSRSGGKGLYWRLFVRHWDPRLLTHAVALQQTLLKRVMAFDPLAGNWLMGVSWQFALPDESACPGMPHPGSWTAAPPQPAPAAAPTPASPSVGVIAGPVRISHPAQSKQDAEMETRTDIEQLLAVLEADRQQHSGMAGPQVQFSRTQPMPLGS